MTQWILTSSVLILLVIAVRGLFKEKMKAKYTYALWLLVLVRLLCPVNFGELSFNLLSLAEEGKAQVVERMEEREEEQSSQQMMQEFGETVYPDNGKVVTILPYYPGEVRYEVSEQVSAAETVEVAEDNTTEAVPVAKDAGFQFPEIHWQKVLPVVWAVGMVVIALVIVSVNISFSTMLGLFRKELPAFTRKGRGSQKLSVYLADGIYSSCLYGVVRPSIYLNRKGMGEQEKKYCIEHEYSHYLQGDMVWSVCRIVCLILHWYNPLVWLAVTLSKKDAELACDERTIERLGEEERYSYGHTLVELAANQSKAVQMFGMATLMASDKKEVVNRVKAITTKKQTKIMTGVLVMCLLVGIGCFVFTGVARGEQENNNNKVTATPTPTPMGKTISPTPMPIITWTGEKESPGCFPEDVLAEESFRLYDEPDVINEEITYKPLSFTDHIKLELVSEEGWSIDLNNDGAKEQLYIDSNGVFINGERQFVSNSAVMDFWLLDIDTTDNMYEFLNGNGDLYIYDGTKFQCVKGIEETYIAQGGNSYARYFGTLGSFTRIDEHTISFEDVSIDGTLEFVEAQYRLDENHNLEIIPQG